MYQVPVWRVLGSIPGKGNFWPVSSSLLLHRSSLFWCCFDISSPEDTQTTEASQESQESQKSSRNKETTRSTADCLQWAIGEGIGDHLSLTDSQGESQNGKLNCNLCAVWLSTKGAICFFVRRPRSACHVERAFSLLGHILTHERGNMSNETLRHLAIMYVNKMDKKRKSEEEQ